MGPYILHIETSSSFCSVALSNGADVIGYRRSEERLTHNAALAPFVDEVIKEGGITVKQLAALSVSAGPGSYTGLRVGVSFAKAMCYALDVPLIGVSTLEGLAISAREALGINATYCPAVDARRMELYVAAFSADGKRIEEDRPLIVDQDAFDKLLAGGQQVVLCGNGVEKCAGILADKNITIHEMSCDARMLVKPALAAFERGQKEDLSSFEPIYIKPPNITVPSKVRL